jgi:hypothetical protein
MSRSRTAAPRAAPVYRRRSRVPRAKPPIREGRSGDYFKIRTT